MAAPTAANDKLGRMKMVVAGDASILADAKVKSLGYQNAMLSMKANWGGDGAGGSIKNMHTWLWLVGRSAPSTNYASAPIGSIFQRLSSDSGNADSANPTDSILYMMTANGWEKFVTCDDAITPSHVIVAAGVHTTAGGDTQETVLVTGALTTDQVLLNIKTHGSSPVTVSSYNIDAADGIVVTLKADPSTDHVLSYAVYRSRV